MVCRVARAGTSLRGQASIAAEATDVMLATRVGGAIDRLWLGETFGPMQVREPVCERRLDRTARPAAGRAAPSLPGQLAHRPMPPGSPRQDAQHVSADM